MKSFDPHRTPCWEEQVEHAKTWSDTSPEVLAAEKRTCLMRWAVGVALVVVPAVVGVVLLVWG